MIMHMEKLVRIAIIGLIVVLTRALLYERRRQFLVSADKLYSKYLSDQKELEKSSVRKNKKLSEKYAKSYQQILSMTTTIKKYILDTGIKEPFAQIDERIGNAVRYYKVSVLDNFYTYYHTSMPDLFNKTIKKAIGHYRYRRNESFSLLFWIEFFIFLPNKIIPILGISSKTILNGIQIIYWILASIGIIFSLLKIF